MASLKEIEQWLEETLQAGAIPDYAVNGVQVRGRQRVERVVTGVSASLELFDRALELGADLILVHHGMFWNKDSRVVEGSLKARLKRLLEHDLTLMAFHLPLDCHPELGNNIGIMRGLGVRVEAPFGRYHGTTLSFAGSLPDPLPVAELTRRVTALFGAPPLVLPFGPDPVRRLAVCSGGAPELIREATAAGVDLFLTGEATEYVYHYAREEGIGFMAAGHHRSERLGVQALGAALAQRFGVEHHFVDSDNPL